MIVGFRGGQLKRQDSYHGLRQDSYHGFHGWHGSDVNVSIRVIRAIRAIRGKTPHSSIPVGTRVTGGRSEIQRRSAFGAERPTANTSIPPDGDQDQDQKNVLPPSVPSVLSVVNIPLSFSSVEGNTFLKTFVLFGGANVLTAVRFNASVAAVPSGFQFAPIALRNLPSL